MTTDVVTVTPETTLREAIELLASHHVSGAPVVAGGHVVGVVSASDVLAFAATTPISPAEPPVEGAADDPALAVPEEWETEDDPGARFFTELWHDTDGVADARFDGPEPPTGDPLADHTVAEVMTREVVALAPAVDVSVAATRMGAAGVHRVLVMDGDALVGIVTSMDVARAVAEHRVGRRTFVFDRSRLERDHDRGSF